MGSALIQPLAGIIGIDATAELHPARPGGKCLFGGKVVARTEHDDMAAG